MFIVPNGCKLSDGCMRRVRVDYWTGVARSRRSLKRRVRRSSWSESRAILREGSPQLPAIATVDLTPTLGPAERCLHAGALSLVE